MTHLTTKTAEQLELPNPLRQRNVLYDKWVPYTRAQYVLNKMQELYEHPACDRPLNLLVTGETNNGKTAIVKRFSRPFKAYEHPDDGGQRWHVLYVQAPPEPDERRFYDLLLGLVGSPPGGSEKIGHKQQRLVRILGNLEVRLLIIDEIQHVLAGSAARQRTFLNVLKALTNELQIPLVCAGISTAANALRLDPQLASRFQPASLSRWVLDDEYLRLLLSFERLLPLRKVSGLADEVLATKILALSEGTIGEIVRILKLATVAAIGAGTERITVTLLNHLDYVPPSKRLK